MDLAFLPVFEACDYNADTKLTSSSYVKPYKINKIKQIAIELMKRMEKVYNVELSKTLTAYNKIQAKVRKNLYYYQDKV
jgi:hypothetical protein